MSTTTLLVKLITVPKVGSKNKIQKQPPKKAFNKLQQRVRYPGPLWEWLWNIEEAKLLEEWGTTLMNCKSPLLSSNVKGSCKAFLNLDLCFVHMQGLAANPAGPQDTYTAPCKRRTGTLGKKSTSVYWQKTTAWSIKFSSPQNWPSHPLGPCLKLEPKWIRFWETDPLLSRTTLTLEESLALPGSSGAHKAHVPQ